MSEGRAAHQDAGEVHLVVRLAVPVGADMGVLDPLEQGAQGDGRHF